MTCTEAYDGSIIAVLEQVRLTAALEGLAIIDLGPDMAEASIMYTVGLAGVSTITTGKLLMTGQPARPTHLVGHDARPLLACPWILPPSRPGGLLMWRSPGARPWTQADHGLAASVAAMLRMTIGTAAGQVGIDHVTGVPNRRWFLEEADRRADRQDHDGTVACISIIDIDDLRRLNVSHGRGHGDKILARLAHHLRGMVRPGDLVARVGADEFAVWQDGMDHLTAAERADSLCTGDALHKSPDDPRVTLSIGIVSRGPGGDDVRSLLRRAYMAAREVKEGGGAGWRVSHPNPLPGISRPAG